MVTRRRFLAILGAGGAVVATGGAVVALLPDSDGKTNGPPVISYGTEACARCRMLIGDARFAAGWRDGSGTEAHFDDIGCMVVRSREQPPAEPVRFWVHDYHTEGWIDASTASFVADPSIKSPMSYGIAAASSADDAKAVALAGQPDSWTGLVSTVKAKG